MKRRKLLFGILLGVSLLFSSCSLGKEEDQITKLDSKYIQSEETAQQKEDTMQRGMPSEEMEQENEEQETLKEDVTSKTEKKEGTEQKDSTDVETEQKVSEKKEEEKTSKCNTSKKNHSQSNNTKSEKSKSAKSQESSDKKENTQKDSKEPAATEKTSDSQTCRISIDCLTILANMQKLSSGKKAFVPSDGWILRNAEVTLKKGDSVYDILYRVCQKYKIHIEASYTPAYNTYYVEGIHQLYEFDCGDLSGWTYRVNGVSPNYGCSKYQVKAGDVIHWSYSCDAGRDIGDD